MPVASSCHARAFNQCDYILLRVGGFESSVFAMQVVKRDIDNAIHLFSRHRSLQYFTSSQFLAHFLRHSKARPQRTQILGSKPFFTLDIRGIGQSYGSVF